MRREHRIFLGLTAIGLSLAACTCGQPPAKSGPGAADGGPTHPPVTLAPLPEAPKIEVPPEALPGANGELAVVVARPQGDIYGELRPTITFSKPIVAMGSVADEQKLPPPANLEPKLEGEWRWLGSASVEFVPKGLVPYATPFKVTVPAGLKALDGTVLKEPYTYAFNTPRPELQGVTPYVGDWWLVPDQQFTLTINQPVEEFLHHVHLTADGAPVTLQLTKTVDIAEERRAQEKDRRFARQDFAQKGFKNRQTRYEFKPVQPLPHASNLRLEVGEGLRGVDGPLTLAQPVDYVFHTYGDMKWLDAEVCMEWDGCAYGPVTLAASNPVDVESLKAHLKVTPAVEIDWEHVHSEFARRTEPVQTVSLPGGWKPGTTYKIEISAGALDTFKQAAPAFSGSVHTRDLDPALSAGPSQALLEGAGDGALPIRTVNLAHASEKLYKLDPPSMARILAAGSWEWLEQSNPRNPNPVLKELAALTPVENALDFKHQKNAVTWTPLPLREQLGAKGGLFFLRLDSNELPHDDHRPRVVVGQLTDLAVHAKLGAAQGLIWVTSLSKGTPVAGAKLAEYDSTGAVVWQGTTDADGLADLPGLARADKQGRHFYDDAPFALVSAEKDGDLGVTASGWEGSASPYAFGVSAAWETEAPVSLAQVFTERGIYRPGDSVELKGFLRDRRLGQIENPGRDVPVTVAVTSSKGDKIATVQTKSTPFGGFSAHVEIPKDAPLGGYEVNITAPNISTSTTFRVEEYRAPQFQVDVTTPKSEVIAGEPLQATVLSRYLFGGAMSGAHVRWTAVRATTDFDPPNNPGFVFGPHVWWWNDDAPQPSSDVTSGGEADSDAQGNVLIDLGKAEAPGGKTYAYTIEAETTDVNRQRLANRVGITVHPAAVYAGINAGEGFSITGKPQRIDLVAVDPQGARVAGQKLALQIKRREWKSIKKKGVGGEWFTQSEPVEVPVNTCSVSTETTPVQCTFTPDKPGLYLLEATATDAAGRSQTTRGTLYAIGQGWVDWQRGDTDRIDLVADKNSYDVGETAHVLVKSPYPEADAILTVEREGVLTKKHVHLSGAATALDVAIDEKLVPNAFVGLVLVRGRVPGDQGVEAGADPGRPATRFGYLELKVEKKSKRLSVAITPDKAEARPRDTVKVDVKVADFQGKPVHGEVALWAVDEGVLRLTAYQPPDPLDALHPQRGLSVRIAEPLVHLVEKQLYGEKGGNAGGGGGEDATGSGFRSQFKTTVLFAPLLETDANGVAHAEIKLPDNLTTYRLMAVAVDALDKGGVGSSKVVVSKKLMALPALPRLARVGDVFEAGVVVHTHGSDVAEATVTAEATGVTLDGPNTRTVPLGDSKGHEVRFKFKADKAGEAVLRFKVEGGGERDGVEQRIPVQLPVELEAVATYGDTTDKRVEGLVPPGGMRTDVGGLDITMSSTILGGFNEGMRQLIEYPYGCIEQMSSRLIPFVALREIYGKFGGSWPVTEADRAAQKKREQWLSFWIGEDMLKTFQVSEPDEVVKLTVSNIIKLQNRDGGFRYWASEGCSEDYASSYAVLALARAKEVGYPVDDAVVKSGQKFLKRVASGQCNPCDHWCTRVDDVTRTFALYTLARTGAPQPSDYGDIYGRRKQLPLFAQAMLSDAMFVGKGDRGQARTLMTELMNNAKETPREVHFEEVNAGSYAPMWASDTRTTAIILQTLTDVAPDHPFVSKIGHYLTKVRQGTGEFRNTQEAAFSLMALTEVVRTKEKDVPDFVAHASLGDKDVETATFKGRTTTIESKHLPLGELGATDKQVPFTFSKQGLGVLYYGALLRYAPKDLPMTPLDRGIVVQRWFEPYSGGGQSQSFYAGDLVRVRVRIGTSQERHYVAVDVPIPAGLEIVDTSLASTAKLPESGKDEGRSEGYKYDSDEDQDSAEPEVDDTSPERLWEGRFWSPFNHEEKRDDRLVLFADHLPPGVHVATFVARATTPGTYVDKPAHAEEMYTPEVFGRSNGGTFTVVDPAAVAQK